jgi:uncharacterized protein
VHRAALAVPLAILLVAGGCTEGPGTESAICVGVPEIALQGRVTDAANILSGPDETRLSDHLARYERTSGHQMVIATADGLGAATPMEFATCLGRRWGIGDKQRNDGILILVAPNQRQSAIAVGYGLEKALTDVEAKAVIRDMTPSFQKGDYAGGLSSGIDAIAAQTGGKP